MYEFVIELIISFKYMAVMLLMAVFSSEYIMPVIGYAASRGSISLTGAITAGTAGSVLASLAVYAIARRVDPKDMYSFIGKHGKWLGIKSKNARRAGKWFDRNAGITIFASRFVPGMRTAAVLPAGAQKMSVWSFILYATLGSAISTTILAYAGYFALESIERLRIIANNISTAGTICVLALALLYIVWLNRRHKRRRVYKYNQKPRRRQNLRTLTSKQKVRKPGKHLKRA